MAAKEQMPRVPDGQREGEGLARVQNFAPNVGAWFSAAPAEVVDTTLRLLADVERMRESETIFPAQRNILKALESVAPEGVRVVILGQDPYHEPGQAMGLSFSVPAGCKLPPSLRNIYKEMASDLGCAVPATGDLTKWAQRGALLLNTTLTVREHAANSHSKLGWQTLTDYILQACMALPQTVVFLAWGKPAIRMIESARAAAGAQAANKHVLVSTHPSPLSANRSTADLHSFMGSRPFSRANELLVAAGERPFDWECIVG